MQSLIEPNDCLLGVLLFMASMRALDIIGMLFAFRCGQAVYSSCKVCWSHSLCRVLGAPIALMMCCMFTRLSNVLINMAFVPKGVRE